MGIKREQHYYGFEQGPIRPPSEAGSLLIRVTRNCPWNRCTFCSVYKQSDFSLRLVEHVIADIDCVYAAVGAINDELAKHGTLSGADLQRLAAKLEPGLREAFFAAANWMLQGARSVFLQDANSLIIKPDWLVAILEHIGQRFPWVDRVTSYARSHTINRISEADMRRLASTGLNRIHVGLESGSDAVLERTRKGVTKHEHVAAGRRVKDAGIELSEYVMPGLGGVDLSREHALETADALNQIDPDYIRLRTLVIPPGTDLHDEHEAGAFERCTDLEVAREIRTFIQALDGIGSVLKSDHVNNLLPEVEGRLPGDKDAMLEALDRYLTLPAGEQTLFQVGRRTGLLQTLADLDSPARRVHLEGVCERLAIEPENVDRVLQERLPQRL